MWPQPNGKHSMGLWPRSPYPLGSNDILEYGLSVYLSFMDSYRHGI